MTTDLFQSLSPAEARMVVDGDAEVAFLDLREAGPFSDGHPLFAVNVPFSALEAAIPALVPNPDAEVVLIDAGDDVAGYACRGLFDMGYSRLSFVAGGTPAWAAAGFTLYEGVNVPSKTLGELAEYRFHPQSIDPDELRRWQRESRDFQFFDCRPPDEFAKMTVPGTLCRPNGELAHRLPTIDADRPIVLTCAGRTRGITGAISLCLIAPGLDVHVLENGTQGWFLAGHPLDRGCIPDTPPALTPAEAEATRRNSAAFLADRQIPQISSETADGMLADRSRTTYAFDVRSSAESADDPLPAFAHVLSGQLVQASDRWIGVRRARVILADDLGLRAGLAAFWLRCLGYEVHVTLIDGDLRNIPARRLIAAPPLASPSEDPKRALDAISSGKARLFDLRPSAAYSRSHIRGASWTHRAELLRIGDTAGTLVMIGDDSPQAALAARDLTVAGHSDLVLVRHNALAGAGLPLDNASPLPHGIAVDVTRFAHGRHDGDSDASRLYLDWEKGLTSRLDPVERAQFRI